LVEKFNSLALKFVVTSVGCDSIYLV